MYDTGGAAPKQQRSKDLKRNDSAGTHESNCRTPTKDPRIAVGLENSSTSVPRTTRKNTVIFAAAETN